MNEFIVWDKNFKKFIDYKVCGILTDGGIAIFKEGHLSCIDYEDHLEAFSCVGKKDINDKKIYADSSIVEFYLTLSHNEIIKKGFVKFNKEDACYEILVEDAFDGYDKYNFIDYEIRNLKVIGTIQQKPELMKV